jgi:hypothetical protein
MSGITGQSDKNIKHAAQEMSAMRQFEIMNNRANKPGWQTSEFWVTMGNLAALGFGVPLEPIQMGVSALYVFGRSLVKAFSK